MKPITKRIWNDGSILSLPLDVCEENSDPINKWRGGDRVEVYDVEKQPILGFGGAFTEAAGYNYAKLSPEEKQRVLEMLFGETGLQYNFCRVAIGACDFSLDSYSHVEEGDSTLSTFSIERDRKYIIPFIKDAIAYSKQEITFLASPWSPPAFMKDSGSMVGAGHLKEEYYPVWAAYIRRFIEEYEKEGIHITYLTPENEPRSHAWQACEFSAEELAKLIICISDELKKLPFTVNILCWDFNRSGMYPHAATIFEKTGDRVCGTGFHWYSGVHLGELRLMHEAFPDKLLVETEFCHGLGARMYGKYRTELMDVLDHYTNAVLEWNLLLDDAGGPYNSRDIGCNTPVFFNRATGRVEQREVYNQMYLFSHFIARGAKVLHTSSAKRHLITLGVKNPDGKQLFYVYNLSTRDDTCTVCVEDVKWKTAVPAGCLVMWEMA